MLLPANFAFPVFAILLLLNGLRIALTASLIMCVIAALASWLRGSKYVHDDEEGDVLAAPVGGDGVGALRLSAAVGPEDEGQMSADIARVRKRL